MGESPPSTGPASSGLANPAPAGAPGAPAQLRISPELLAKLERVAPLPSVYHELRALTAVRTTDSRSISGALEKDPVLAGRVLKLANSAIFGFRGKITGLHLAVSLLGNNNVHNLTSVLVVMAQFRRPASGDFNPAEFWKHGVLCGCCATVLAEHYGYSTRDDIFTFGLLHDLGKIAVYENLPDEFARIIKLNQSGILWRKAEHEVLGIDHTGIGALVAQSWKLPDDFVQVIRSHHLLPEGTASLTDQRKFLVFLGNVVAHMAEGRKRDKKWPSMKAEFLQRFRLDQEGLVRLATKAFEDSREVRAEFR